MVVRTTSWCEGVLLGRPRVLPDRSRVYVHFDLYLKATNDSQN
jgi:hypothetical protein